MDQSMSVGEALREDFLQGKRIVLADFASEHGVTRSAVFAAMRQFGEMVKASPHPFVPCAMVWECVDVEAMRRFVPAKKSGRGRPRKPELHDTPVGRLCAAWGIRLADIALPYTRHRMTVLEDELEMI